MHGTNAHSILPTHHNSGWFQQLPSAEMLAASPAGSEFLHMHGFYTYILVSISELHFPGSIDVSVMSAKTESNLSRSRGSAEL